MSSALIYLVLVTHVNEAVPKEVSSLSYAEGHLQSSRLFIMKYLVKHCCLSLLSNQD